LEEATRKSIAERRSLAGVLSGMSEVAHHLDSATVRELDVPEQYLGMADEFRTRLLASEQQQTTGQPKPSHSKKQRPKTKPTNARKK
jgi:hypothetical protein